VNGDADAQRERPDQDGIALADHEKALWAVVPDHSGDALGRHDVSSMDLPPNGADIQIESFHPNLVMVEVVEKGFDLVECADADQDGALALGSSEHFKAPEGIIGSEGRDLLQLQLDH